MTVKKLNAKIKEWTGQETSNLEDLIWALAMDEDAHDVFNREVRALRAVLRREMMSCSRS